MSPEFEIILIAIFVCLSCSLIGCFLVLRKMSMISDAVSHAILLGVVLVFFITEEISSPAHILGAALSGIILIGIVEIMYRSRLVKKDTAIGLVFPFFFSVGVILITAFADNVHLDIDSVILGEIIYAPFNRFESPALDFVSKPLLMMFVIFIFNLLFVTVFYKELKLTTFDPGLAIVFGFSPAVISALLTLILSITAVGAFEAVGSILVVALFTAPPATAFLLTNKLKHMLWISCSLSVFSAFLGYQAAFFWDFSLSGTIATAEGGIFLLVFLFNPTEGAIYKWWKEWSGPAELKISMLLVHISHHQGTKQENEECRVKNLSEHLHWKNRETEKILNKALRQELVKIDQEGLVRLTDLGSGRAVIAAEW